QQQLLHATNLDAWLSMYHEKKWNAADKNDVASVVVTPHILSPIAPMTALRAVPASLVHTFMDRNSKMKKSSQRNNPSWEQSSFCKKSPAGAPSTVDRSTYVATRPPGRVEHLPEER